MQIQVKIQGNDNDKADTSASSKSSLLSYMLNLSLEGKLDVLTISKKATAFQKKFVYGKNIVQMNVWKSCHHYMILIKKTLSISL